MLDWITKLFRKERVSGQVPPYARPEPAPYKVEPTLGHLVRPNEIRITAPRPTQITTLTRKENARRTDTAQATSSYETPQMSVPLHRIGETAPVYISGGGGDFGGGGATSSWSDSPSSSSDSSSSSSSDSGSSSSSD